MPPFDTKPRRTRKASSKREIVLAKPMQDKRVLRSVAIKPSIQFDSYRTLLAEGATPSKMAALLRRIDAGEINVLCELQMEMEAKSIQYQGLCEMRRNALTGLDWCIEPDQDLLNDALANEVAQYCEETLVSLPSFDGGEDGDNRGGVLDHLASAIGPNIAVAEKVWSKAELVGFNIVPCTRLKTNDLTNLGIAIRTEENQTGIDVASMPNKFIVFHRNCNGGFPFRKTLTHASILPFLFINLSQKDWAAYSELFGQPLRYGTAVPGATPEVLNTLKSMLEGMGSDTAGMFPEGIDIKFLQSQGTGETYQRQLDYANTRLAIGWLGQNLTTEISQQGSRAAAQVHNSVRRDLLKSDIRAEAPCIRNQILAPMVALKFPGREAPVPYFVRKIEGGRDIEGEQSDREIVKLAQELGLEVMTEWLYSALRIPKPKVSLPETMKLEKKVETPVGPDGKPIPKAPGKDPEKKPLDKNRDV